MPDDQNQDAPAAAPAAADHKVFQVKFKSGQGQQVPANSAEEARAMVVAHYGEDYEIESVEEVAPSK